MEKYNAKLPEFDDGQVYIPPSTVLATTRLPKLSMMGLVGRGDVKNNGAANSRIKALRARNLVVCTIDPKNPNAVAFSQVLNLFLNEPGRENDAWSQAQTWQLPDPAAAVAWLNIYNSVTQQAQTKWSTFVGLQRQLDEVVADWYGFNSTMRAAINQGLPWARRRRSNQPPTSSVTSAEGITNRTPIKSSQIYAIGYDQDSQTLEVEFPEGEIWQYQAVPSAVFQGFEMASSKGKYYSQKIKGKYTSRKL